MTAVAASEEILRSIQGSSGDTATAEQLAQLAYWRALAVPLPWESLTVLGRDLPVMAGPARFAACSLPNGSVTTDRFLYAIVRSDPQMARVLVARSPLTQPPALASSQPTGPFSPISRLYTLVRTPTQALLANGTRLAFAARVQRYTGHLSRFVSSGLSTVYRGSIGGLIDRLRNESHHGSLGKGSGYDVDDPLNWGAPANVSRLHPAPLAAWLAQEQRQTKRQDHSINSPDARRPVWARIQRSATVRG